MERAIIQAEIRERTGKGANRRIRAEGRIPAILYGNGKEPTAIAVDPVPVAKTLNGPYGRNTVCDLTVDGEDTPRMAIIRDFQLHPWKRMLEHVDFWEITPETELVVDVPLERSGRSEAEKAGGQAFQTRYEVRVRCLPEKIPAAITYDMSHIGTGSHQIMMSQVPLPEGVTAEYKHDYNVIRVKGVKAMEAMLEAAEEELEEAAEEAGIVEEASEEPVAPAPEPAETE
ncbi:MAG: 50S ribosomal protein L25 [Myxococcota bacterium]